MKRKMRSKNSKKLGSSKKLNLNVVKTGIKAGLERTIHRMVADIH